MVLFREYVLGFMFDSDGQRVAVIVKNEPDWQKGKINGIGGKIEINERPHNAMSREFQEETGVITDPSDWISFATMHGSDWIVHCFSLFSTQVDSVSTTTDEYVFSADINDLLSGEFGELIPNLQWLIPLALADEPVFAKISHPEQP